MSIYKKKGSPYFYTRFRLCGIGVNQSTRCLSKSEAQEYEEKLRREIRQQVLFGKKPKRTWTEAALRWANERVNKRGFNNDRLHLKWIQQHLGKYALEDIDKEVLWNLRQEKEKLGVQMATINRMLNVVSAILNCAFKQWDWINKVPPIPKGKVDNGRLRWLTLEEEAFLLDKANLPTHIKEMAAFTLATGLRKSNVTGLCWSQVDMLNKHLVIHPDQAKSKKPLGVPLNEDSMQVLRRQIGNHPMRVFAYRGKPINNSNTKAWRSALVRAGIANFTWHDLRHTWASRHVQNGTTLQELMELGGWSSIKMVLRYAHLSSNHLKAAAERISGAKSVVAVLSVA